MELAGYVVNAVVLEGRSVAEVGALIAKTGTFEPEYGRQVGHVGSRARRHFVFDRFRPVDTRARLVVRRCRS
jgi:hypothetical protein